MNKRENKEKGERGVKEKVKEENGFIRLQAQKYLHDKVDL